MTADTIRVYIVDDEPLIHGVWRRILARRDFDVVSFQAAGPALEALGADPDVDVLVTDLAMPEMDGMTLLARMKVERPDVEVIMVTAHAGLDAGVAAVQAGAYHFLAKPFDAEAPPILIRQAAERKRLLLHVRSLEEKLRDGGPGNHPPAAAEQLTYVQAKDHALEAFQRAYLEGVLARASGNISEAARLSGLDRSNFKRLMRRSRR